MNESPSVMSSPDADWSCAMNAFTQIVSFVPSTYSPSDATRVRSSGLMGYSVPLQKPPVRLEGEVGARGNVLEHDRDVALGLARQRINTLRLVDDFQAGDVLVHRVPVVLRHDSKGRARIQQTQRLLLQLSRQAVNLRPAQACQPHP